jgi:hypothetical protein
VALDDPDIPSEPTSDTRRERAVEWLEGRRILLSLAALVVGAVVGLAWPDSASTSERAINPTLALLLLATFPGVPVASIAPSLRMAGSSAVCWC